jgi:GNAT superfamily N-acetyltransferase
MSVTFMNDKHFITNNYSISTDKNLLDVDMIYNFLTNESYWAKGITQDRVKLSIANSMCFGVYHVKKQIGLARLITDKATFAYIADVFITVPYRGLGLSKWLIQTIKEHHDLQGIRRWMLATADAHGLYAQFGFGQLTNTERWMQAYKPYTVLVNKE